MEATRKSFFKSALALIGAVSLLGWKGRALSAFAMDSKKDKPSKPINRVTPEIARKIGWDTKDISNY